ncbi:MAG: pyridoxal 5'-phosphate synthase glutaminase subunit PdxT [Armatimonadaceae bacterium]
MKNSPLEAKVRVGILALQGDYAAHRHATEVAGGESFEVRTPEQVREADALILPGGESTTIGRLMTRFGLDTAIQEAHAEGKPIFGTCAGMILLAKRIAHGAKQGGQPVLGLLDVSVARNAWGRQVDSFEADIDAPTIAPNATVRGVFIRAPLIEEVGPGVDVLARFDDKIVLVQQGNVLASAFHPELTGDSRVHRYFLKMVDRQ